MVVGRPRDLFLVRAVKRSLRGSGARVQSIDAPEAVPGIGNSDHRSFWRKGVRAVMVTDTAWYRNPRYHTADDTPDTLDYARMAKIADGIAACGSRSLIHCAAHASFVTGATLRRASLPLPTSTWMLWARRHQRESNGTS